MMDYIFYKNNINDVNLKNDLMTDIFGRLRRKRVEPKIEVKPLEKEEPKEPEKVESEVNESEIIESEINDRQLVMLSRLFTYFPVIYNMGHSKLGRLFGMSSQSVANHYYQTSTKLKPRFYKQVIKAIFEGNNDLAKRLVKFMVIDLTGDTDGSSREDLIELLDGIVKDDSYTNGQKRSLMEIAIFEATSESDCSEEETKDTEDTKAEEEACDEVYLFDDQEDTVKKCCVSIKYIRYMTSMTATEFSSKIGINKSYLYALESLRYIPSNDMYIKIRTLLLHFSQRHAQDVLECVVDNKDITFEDLLKFIDEVNKTYIIDINKVASHREREKMKFLKVVDLCKEKSERIRNEENNGESNGTRNLEGHDETEYGTENKIA